LNPPENRLAPKENQGKHAAVIERKETEDRREKLDLRVIWTLGGSSGAVFVWGQEFVGFFVQKIL